MPDPNRFLRGPFAPVEEEITAFDLPVTGRLPAGLNGRYLRNGPNPLGLDDPSCRFREGHWFLGPGMVHGVRPCDFSGMLPGGFAAHTKPDHRPGELSP